MTLEGPGGQAVPVMVEAQREGQQAQYACRYGAAVDAIVAAALPAALPAAVRSSRNLHPWLLRAVPAALVCTCMLPSWLAVLGFA